jgi:hypothetical protein
MSAVMSVDRQRSLEQLTARSHLEISSEQDGKAEQTALPNKVAPPLNSDASHDGLPERDEVVLAAHDVARLLEKTLELFADSSGSIQLREVCRLMRRELSGDVSSLRAAGSALYEQLRSTQAALAPQQAALAA